MRDMRLEAGDRGGQQRRGYLHGDGPPPEALAHESPLALAPWRCPDHGLVRDPRLAGDFTFRPPTRPDLCPELDCERTLTQEAPVHDAPLANSSRTGTGTQAGPKERKQPPAFGQFDRGVLPEPSVRATRDLHAAYERTIDVCLARLQIDVTRRS